MRLQVGTGEGKALHCSAVVVRDDTLMERHVFTGFCKCCRELLHFVSLKFIRCGSSGVISILVEGMCEKQYLVITFIGSTIKLREILDHLLAVQCPSLDLGKR